MKRHLQWVLLAGIGMALGALPAFAQTTPISAAPISAAPTSATPISAEKPSFAAEGEKTCLKCHDEQKVVGILKTPHAVKGDHHSPFGAAGCESCHGASPDHVAKKVKFPSVVFKGPNMSPVAARNEQCLSCHQSGLRMNWQGSQHATNDVACTNCHTIHVEKDPVLVKFTQPEKCFTCHTEQKSDSFKFSHHPIREGKVVCSDCHNPHGSAGPKMLKEFTVNETCYNCHAEKRGPLLWEHQPVRENCLNCHTPHGSTQARLLTQRPPYLCQECHANSTHQSIPLNGQSLPGQVAQNVRMLARGCVNCHSQVHGSNSPNGLFFTR